jgi:hypothetical protein
VPDEISGELFEFVRRFVTDPPCLLMTGDVTPETLQHERISRALSRLCARSGPCQEAHSYGDDAADVLKGPATLDRTALGGPVQTARARRQPVADPRPPDPHQPTMELRMPARWPWQTDFNTILAKIRALPALT